MAQDPRCGIQRTGFYRCTCPHLRPAYWSVNAPRGNRHKYFGECGILHSVEECVIPAHVEAANDTAADPSIWMPPGNVRGDLARSLMYMALRYDGEMSDGNEELDLELSDCPTDSAFPGWDSKQLMGYLSILVKWHEEDPVDLVEQERNDQVCQMWQGNRNPFVDYPDLVETYFGPDSGYPGYDCAPTPVVGIGNSCQDLKPGDVMFTGFRSDNPDVVTMVALVDLSPSTVLYMTDNAYTGTFLRSNEGTVKFQVPLPGIKTGTTIAYGSDTNLPFANLWDGSTIALSVSGDNIFLYCKNNEQDGPSFLSGLIFTTGGWIAQNVDEQVFGTSKSALPKALEESNAHIELTTHLDNYIYTRSRIGSESKLLEFISDPSSWSGSNAADFDISEALSDFTVTKRSPCERMKPGDIMFTGFKSDNPDVITLVALENIPPSLNIYMTDNAYTGSFLRSNEGTVKFQTPSTGIQAGTTIAYGSDASNLPFANLWEGSSVALSVSGDNIFLYCEIDDGAQHFLSGLIYTTGGWIDANSDEEFFGTTKSALPNELKEASAHIEFKSHVDNSIYANERSGSKDELLMLISDSTSWSGSNSPDFDMTRALSDFALIPDKSFTSEESHVDSSPYPLPDDDSAASIKGKFRNEEMCK
mmetsp:Transcript_20392/g.31191  ORF Transcript_20392/g.31191 Transcript_20392/m.31191 type:complete len:645 (+) Transcript_20392:279-2213(+)